MSKYFDGNQAYWDKGYEAANVESFVFRWYGRVLKAKLGIDGAQRPKLLDFGCGTGASLEFFHRQGFEVYGVDISQPDIQSAKKRLPEISDRLKVIPPEPSLDSDYFGVKFDIVIGIQAFYYFNHADFSVMMQSIYKQMTPNAIIYGTMIGTKCWYYKNAEPVGDGLYRVSVNSDRLDFGDYFIQFTESEEDLLQKYSLFDRVEVGYYDAQYLSDEGPDFHWTFTGKKPLK